MEKAKAKRIGLTVLVVIVVLAFIGIIVIAVKKGMNTYSNAPAPIQQISLDIYKTKGSNLDYRKAMFGEYNSGDLVIFTGKIYQVINETEIALYTQEAGYLGYLGDNVIVTFPVKPKVLEDDIVTIYARYIGIEKYKTVLGSVVEVPHFYGDWFAMVTERK